jgi:hypothetical protein
MEQNSWLAFIDLHFLKPHVVRSINYKLNSNIFVVCMTCLTECNDIYFITTRCNICKKFALQSTVVSDIADRVGNRSLSTKWMKISVR